MIASDSYKTIRGGAEGLFKDRGSRFLTYAYHVENEEEIKGFLSELRKKYYDATHHCYAWRLGAHGESFRANDDGEPSGSAGRPILGQLLSNELTYTLVVVIRYFGGTELGIPGLINAYKEATLDAIRNSEVITLTEDAYYEVVFPYLVMNDVMKVIKSEQPRVIDQEFDNLCRMKLAVQRSQEELLIGKLSKAEGIELNFIEYK